MITPEVSVIIAVYNAADFIEDSVYSILNQTFTNYELILVNDASTDNSLEIIQKLAYFDKRIKLINLEKNSGRVYARNTALNESKGKYIAIQDADDTSFPNRLQKQVDFLNNHPQIFLIGSGATKIDGRGREIGIHKPLTGKTNVAKALLKKNCIYHSSVMYRKSTIRYREKFPLSQDYDLYLQILKQGKHLDNLSDLLVSYRIHEKAASWSHAAKQRLFANKALAFYANPQLYDLFNPEDILKLDLNNSTDKIVLSAEIETLFKLKSYKKMRSVCKTYFKHYGYFNSFTLLFVVTFFPEKMIYWILKSKSTLLSSK